MYFATYQAIAKTSTAPVFTATIQRISLTSIVVDECHRGSAADDSNWKIS